MSEGEDEGWYPKEYVEYNSSEPKEPDIVTTEDIDKNVWEAVDGKWYFSDECQQGTGPYDTRGQAIDAYIKYCKELE